VRAKGFVETSEGVRVVQGVGPRIELAAPESPPDPERLGLVVLVHRAEPGA
jgi:hypothetical protein